MEVRQEKPEQAPAEMDKTIKKKKYREERYSMAEETVVRNNSFMNAQNLGNCNLLSQISFLAGSREKFVSAFSLLSLDNMEEEANPCYNEISLSLNCFDDIENRIEQTFTPSRILFSEDKERNSTK